MSTKQDARLSSTGKPLVEVDFNTLKGFVDHGHQMAAYSIGICRRQRNGYSTVFFIFYQHCFSQRLFLYCAKSQKTTELISDDLLCTNINDIPTGSSRFCRRKLVADSNAKAKDRRLFSDRYCSISATSGGSTTKRLTKKTRNATNFLVFIILKQLKAVYF